VDTLPSDAPFRILRRAGAEPGDVIVLSRAATGATLSQAVEQLLLIRRLQGDTARVTGSMRVRPRQEAPGRRARMLPWAGRVINDLHGAAPRTVGGVGTIPAVIIWLPPQARRAQT
jgi:hypothetical protein